MKLFIDNYFDYECTNIRYLRQKCTTTNQIHLTGQLVPVSGVRRFLLSGAKRPKQQNYCSLAKQKWYNLYLTKFPM
jgi:hypothetical protein